MSSVKEIDDPYTIVPLTQPIDQANGRILAARVYSLHGSRKRKRSEVAVSADGEAIKIYNIQKSRTVASYEVSSQTAFTSPPCCAYRKAGKNRSARRCTYTSVVQTSGGRRKPQVILFEEELQSKAVRNHNKHVYEVPEGRSDVAAIESIPIAESGESHSYAHNILVIYKNGHVDCLSADLKELKWSSKLRDLLPAMQGKTAESSKVEYTCVINSSTACQGLLKEREDVLALLSGSEKGTLHTASILCLITTSTRSKDANKPPVSLHLISLPSFSTDHINTTRSQTRHLVSWSLGEAPSESHSPSYSLQVESGSLSYLSASGIVSYDLRGTTPKQLPSLSHPVEPFHSFLSLQHSLSLVCSESFCGLFDLEHSSLQAFLRCNEPELVNGDTKKRHRGVSGLDLQGVNFVGYFSSLELAVGITGTDLVGFPLNSVLPSRVGKSHKGGPLVNSIGKGINPKALSFAKTTIGDSATHAIHQTGKISKELENTMRRLSDLVAKDDVHEFEALFAQTVGLQRDTTEYDAWLRRKGQNGVQTHDSMDVDNPSADDPPLPSWTYSRSFDAQEHFEHRPISLHALSRMVSWTSVSSVEQHAQNPATSIKIQFYAPNVLQYLLKTNCLSRDVIQRALRGTAELPGEGRTIAEGDLITAIVNLDPGLAILHFVLNSGVYLEIGEIVQVIKILIQHLDTRSLPQLASQLLPNGSSEETEELDVDIENAIDSMSAMIDDAQTSLDDGVVILAHCLQPALIALHSFPKARIITYLRLKLTAHELFFLMNMLRIQLRGGGWIYRYFVETAEAELADGDGPSDAAILIIADLLSHVLDAIGTGGWLLAAQQTPATSEDAPDDLIHGLRQDISAAVEGIYEATFMKGLLTEFLRYGSRIKSSNRIPDAERLQAQRKPFPVPTGGAVHGDAENKVLPLGLKVKEKVAMKRNETSGGEANKSQREIGMEISKTVPKYSIERIII